MKGQSFFDFLKPNGSVGVLGNQSAVGADRVTSINYPFYPVLRTNPRQIFLMARRTVKKFSVGSSNFTVGNPSLQLHYFRISFRPVHTIVK